MTRTGEGAAVDIGKGAPGGVRCRVQSFGTGRRDDGCWEERGGRIGGGVGEHRQMIQRVWVILYEGEICDDVIV